MNSTNLTAHAVYDRRTGGYFGRVNVKAGGKLIYYRMVRICRVCRADAMQDAYKAIKEAREVGQLMI